MPKEEADSSKILGGTWRAPARERKAQAWLSNKITIH